MMPGLGLLSFCWLWVVYQKRWLACRQSKDDDTARDHARKFAFVLFEICCRAAFDDERITWEQFAAQKAAGRFPNDQLPILYVNGKVRTQSTPILVYVCRLAGLYPTDPALALEVSAK